MSRHLPSEKIIIDGKEIIPQNITIGDTATVANNFRNAILSLLPKDFTENFELVDLGKFSGTRKIGLENGKYNILFLPSENAMLIKYNETRGLYGDGRMDILEMQIDAATYGTSYSKRGYKGEYDRPLYINPQETARGHSFVFKREPENFEGNRERVFNTLLDLESFLKELSLGGMQSQLALPLFNNGISIDKPTNFPSLFQPQDDFEEQLEIVNTQKPTLTISEDDDEEILDDTLASTHLKEEAKIAEEVPDFVDYEDDFEDDIEEDISSSKHAEEAKTTRPSTAIPQSAGLHRLPAKPALPPAAIPQRSVAETLAAATSLKRVTTKDNISSEEMRRFMDYIYKNFKDKPSSERVSNGKSFIVTERGTSTFSNPNDFSIKLYKGSKLDDILKYSTAEGIVKTKSHLDKPVKFDHANRGNFFKIIENIAIAAKINEETLQDILCGKEQKRVSVSKGSSRAY